MKRLERLAELGDVQNMPVVLLQLADDIEEYLKTHKQKDLALLLGMSEIKTSVIVQMVRAYISLRDKPDQPIIAVSNKQNLVQL